MTRPAFHRMRNPLTTFFLSAFLVTGMAVAPASAKNPFTSYFSGLLDETRAEIATGKLLMDGLIAESGGPEKIVSFPNLNTRVTELAGLCPRNTLPYEVVVLDSPIPGEIPFPGGPIMITKGTLALAKTSMDQDFLLARNIMHIALRQPMISMKKEGLYGKILRFVKAGNRIEKSQMKTILREYIKAVGEIDQFRADREALSLVTDQKAMKQAAIEFLKRCGEPLWPSMPWEGQDLAARILALENLPLR